MASPAPPQLVDVLPALYQSMHPQFAKLVGLSRDFFHDRELLANTALVESAANRGPKRTRLHGVVTRNSRARAAELLAACPTLAARRALLQPANVGFSSSLLWVATDAPVATLLLGAGADARVADAFGLGAVSYAANRGKLDVMRVLLASLGSDAERQSALASTLRYCVHEANLKIRAMTFNLDSMLLADDGSVYDHVLELGVDEVPDDLQEACAPIVRASLHACVRANAAIRQLALLSPAELDALVTPADKSAEDALWRGGTSDIAGFLGQNVLKPAAPPGTSWVVDCVEGFLAALLALEAGAPLSTPVPARMTPWDAHEFDADDARSRDQPLSAWLQAHAEWFGPPLVAAAVRRHGARAGACAAAAAR